MSELLYDRIGAGYGARRGGDPRIAAAVGAALGDAREIVNVGAGAGAYEPADRPVLAVEPSAAMRAQRPATAAPCIAGHAEALPLDDGQFDAAMALYTDFHWSDRARGVAELLRVSRRRVVVLTVDGERSADYWLLRDYLPQAASVFAPLAGLLAALPGGATVTPVTIPHDCRDGFVHAYWRRPDALLDPRVRASMAVFGRLSGDVVEAALQRLARDLRDGSWARRNAQLLGREALDLGHRLVVVERQPSLV